MNILNSIRKVLQISTIAVALTGTMAVPAQAASKIFSPLIDSNDVSKGDGTCLFTRSGNDVTLNIFVEASTYLYVTTSANADEDEEMAIYMSFPSLPYTIFVGTVGIDGDGDGFVAFTKHWNGTRFVGYIRCEAWFDEVAQ